MRRAMWWLLGIACLAVAAGIAVGGWRAGVAVGLPVYLVTLVPPVPPWRTGRRHGPRYRRTRGR